MNIIPAIDLKNNKCVRLFQGKYEKTTVYDQDPIQQATDFEKSGCKYLHIIDIDAATNNFTQNKKTIIEIINEVSMHIQLGGGIRDYEQIKFWFDVGIDSLIIGSMALSNPKLLLKIINEFPNKIIVAVDNKNNKLMLKGWSEEANMNINNLLSYYEKEKIKGYIFTDINRDGTLLGLDINKIKKFVSSTGHNVIVGGGLRGIEDIKNLRSLKLDNINGVVVGKAYYEGKIKLNAGDEIGIPSIYTTTFQIN